MSVIALPTAGRAMALVAAVDAFLDRFRDAPATRATYTETLRRLRETAGDQLPVAALTPEIYEQTMTRWDERAANTWNKHLSALTSFTAYCHRQDWLTTDPVSRVRTKSCPMALSFPRGRTAEIHAGGQVISVWVVRSRRAPPCRRGLVAAGGSRLGW